MMPAGRVRWRACATRAYYQLVQCSHCGADVPSDARFCPSCGQELLGLGSHDERKPVSVLFVDMVGSTARADGADPEDVRDVNQLYYEVLRVAIEPFGGTLEKFIGDAVVAVFGAPLARDDDAERAVRAALNCVGGIAELNRERPGLNLQVRAGVCTGDAIVTLDAVPGEPLATGDVVNTAARLQSAAPPGGVIVDDGTYRLTRDTFTFDAIDEIDAKGKRDPVPAWLVGHALLEPWSRRPSATPFVGRDRELEVLRAVWDEVVTTGRPHLITLMGPPGIGKSRLTREVSAQLEGAGARVLWGRSLPYAEQSPYRAIAEIVQRAAGIVGTDGPAEARGKLGDLLTNLMPPGDVPDMTRYLSLLLGLGLDEGVDDPIHLQYATRRLVEELAAAQPTVLMFEDVYWADEPLLDLIDYLVAKVDDRPVLFLAAARPELLQRRGTWGAGATAQTMLPLDPLTGDEAVEMVSGLVTPDRRAAIERVVETGAGNPLFLEELAGSIDTVDGELPPTVRAAITARIDALPPDARTALLHASVMGQSFWRDVVAGTAQIDDVGGALGALTHLGLVQPLASTTGHEEYMFKHALVRDAAYDMLPRSTRRVLHGAAAGLIEAGARDPGEVAWILAYHLREAGEAERASSFYLVAADRARDAIATEEAWDLYSRALELAGSDEQRRTIRLRRGVALIDLWEATRGLAELEELLPELEGAQEIEALLACGRAFRSTERTEELFDWSRRALAIASADAPEFEPRALALLAHAHSMRGEAGDLDHASELGERALAGWQQNAHLGELMEHYHIQEMTNYFVGRYKRSLELAEQASATSGLTPRSMEWVIGANGMIGLSLAGLGRYEEAIARGDEAIEAAHRLGADDSRVLNYSTGSLRDVYAAAEARRRSEIVVDRLGPSDFNMPWMNARADLIGALMILEEFGEVEKTWPSAWEDAVASPAWEHWLITGRLAAVRAQLELALGRPEESVTWANRALDLARPVRRRKYVVVATIELGRALAAQGQFEEAARLLHDAVVEADELGSPLYRWQVRAALADAAREVPAESGAVAGLLGESARIIREVADGLATEHAAQYLGAGEVAAVLELAG